MYKLLYYGKFKMLLDISDISIIWFVILCMDAPYVKHMSVGSITYFTYILFLQYNTTIKCYTLKCSTDWQMNDHGSGNFSSYELVIQGKMFPMRNKF